MAREVDVADNADRWQPGLARQICDASVLADRRITVSDEFELFVFHVLLELVIPPNLNFLISISTQKDKRQPVGIVRSAQKAETRL